jgi:hypothetical protein
MAPFSTDAAVSAAAERVKWGFEVACAEAFVDERRTTGVQSCIVGLDFGVSRTFTFLHGNQSTP